MRKVWRCLELRRRSEGMNFFLTDASRLALSFVSSSLQERAEVLLLSERLLWTG